MTRYDLDYNSSLLLEEYRAALQQYKLLQTVVMQKINELVTQSGIELNSVESRIKTEDSFTEKLERKGHKYMSINDITDIFGARITVFYNEDVDRIAAMVEKLFDIDWTNSVDKRKMHQYNSFGYNSLHYICRLPESLYADPLHPELNRIPFELQMRTALQHVWSVIQHDIGYKSEIETPIEHQRDFSRLAGLLELADNEFSRIRAAIIEYRRRVQSLMQNGQLDQIALDADTLSSYLDKHPFDDLNHRIAAINHAELHHTSAMHYLKALRHIGMQTIGDIENMIHENSDDAYQLALLQLGGTDLDILSETIGLQNLCLVHILKHGGTQQDIHQFFNIINGRSMQHNAIAAFVVELAQKLKFMKH